MLYCMTAWQSLTKYCMIIKVLSTTVWLSTKYCMLFVMTAARWWLCGLGRKTRKVQCCYKMLTGCCLATAGRSSLYALCKYCTDCTLYTQICFSLYSILSAVMISVTATATTTATTTTAAQCARFISEAARKNVNYVSVPLLPFCVICSSFRW